MKYDIIVIGSGLGGLECAHLLSQQGYSVLVLEREVQPGGCMQSYKRRGFSFDTGLHYCGGLAPGNALYGIFKRLGLMKLPWQHLDPEAFDRVTIGDRDFAYAEGYEAFVETLAREFPKERKGLEQYAADMKEIGSHLFDAIKPREADQFFATSVFGRSAWEYLHQTFHDELLINVLSGSSLKMELAKDTLPMYTFVQGNNSFVESSWRLKGDGSLLVDSLVNDIRHMGGEVICNAGVKELVEKDGKIVAARCENGERYEAGMFISNAHPAVTLNLVKESQVLKKVFRNRINRLENTYGMFTVSLGLKPGSVEYFNWNQYLYRRPNVWTYFEDNDPVEGALISCRCPSDGSRYTPVIDLLTPMPWSKVQKWENTTVGHRGQEYLDWKAKVTEQLITLASDFIPNLASKVEVVSTSSPLTYRDYTLTPQGSCYGVRKDWHNPMLTLLSAHTPIPNLYLTGQSLTLHGLLGVTMTTAFTCAEIIGREKAWELLQEDDLLNQ